MADVSEMMLDGTLCESCGVALAGPPMGYPRYCSERCRADRATVPPPPRHHNHKGDDDDR